MSATILTIAQQKGGAGKTTLAAQIAVSLAKAGRRVATVDIDPQASLTGWHSLRRETLRGDGGIGFSAVAGWRLAAEIDRLRKGFDAVIVDSPPHAETETRIAIRAADLVLAPLQPSPMDLWATQPTLALAAKEGKPVLLVLNRAPPRGRVMEAVRAALDEHRMPLARAEIGNRTAFAASMMEGLGVAETEPSGAATAEIAALIAEIEALVGGRR